jgi:excisionase family DNA binding protein
MQQQKSRWNAHPCSSAVRFVGTASLAKTQYLPLAQNSGEQNLMKCAIKPQRGRSNSKRSLRELLFQLPRVKPYSATWRVNDDDSLTLVELREISSLTQDQRLTLAERIERIDHAITAKELARLLNVSKITMFKQCKTGRVPCFRIGTSVRFDPKLVAAWLRKQ